MVKGRGVQSSRTRAMLYYSISSDLSGVAELDF